MNTEGFTEKRMEQSEGQHGPQPETPFQGVQMNPTTNEIEIKKIVSKFMENKQAFEYFEKHTMEKLKKNASKSTCPHILLDDNTLLCIKSHKNKYNISTENITIYFRNGNFVCAEDGKNTIKYTDDVDIDIPNDFYIVGQTIDNEEQTYKVLPIFENRYMISKYIADKFILMYQDKSIFIITYEDKPLYSQGPTTQDYIVLYHYI